MEGGKVIDGITYARRKVTTAKVMVKVAVNYTLSLNQKSKCIQRIDGERSIWSQCQQSIKSTVARRDQK